MGYSCSHRIENGILPAPIDRLCADPPSSTEHAEIRSEDRVKGFDPFAVPPSDFETHFGDAYYE